MAKNFKSSIGTPITKNEAMSWIEKYDKEMRSDKQKDTKSVFYGRDQLLKLLNVEDCAGITFFLALRHEDAVEKETVNLVLVSTKEDGTLMWGDEGAVAKADGGDARPLDRGYPCPPYCPK